MSDNDLVEFRIQISKEIGAMTERLRSIDEHFHDFRKTTDAMWKKIDKLNEELTSMKIKVAVVSLVISLSASNFDVILKAFQ